MLETGATAPEFSLPGVVDDEIRTVDLAAVAGTDVVVLAFYPADFSNVCTEELCSLRDLELFDLQNDVTILGLSTDTAFSHRQFAAEYDLNFPLLSDNDGTVAEQYGALYEEGLGGHRRIAKRAVFVLDADRTIQYAWASDDPSDLPDLEAVRDAIANVSDDEAAVERYRVAHTDHEDGRRLFEDGTGALADDDWIGAADAFEAAVPAFESAIEAFDAAVRLADDDAVAAAADHGRDVANHYRNAAKWYAEAADNHARGEASLGEEFRDDAERAAESARDHDPLPAPGALAASAVDE